MAKVLLIGDTHNGANGNNMRLLRQNVELYKNFIFPLIEYNKIDFVIDLGDFFDDREKIDIRVLKTVREEMLNDLPVPWYFVVGNHNTYFKNNNTLNNLQETIGDLEGVNIVDSFKQVDNIDIYPWILAKNVETYKQILEKTEGRFAVGHFEFAGFPFDKSRVAEVKEKLTPSDFAKYEKVFSGHYHIASEKGNIVYVGSPVQLTWIDVDVEKRVAILDTKTGEVEYVVNTNNLYHQYTVEEDGDISHIPLDEIPESRVKIKYSTNTSKDVINNIQSILKNLNPDQLIFVPTGAKKKTDKVEVKIESGIQQSIIDYLNVYPFEESKVHKTVEKILLSYLNKTNKE